MSSAERPDDLAAMFARLARKLGTAEEPLLAKRGLTMWEYIVLSRLSQGPAPNQLTLARDVGHDKTRLVKVLDGLQDRQLIERTPDPEDRRSSVVTITREGRRLHRATQAAIRKMEDGVLEGLTLTERRALLTALSKLDGSD